MLATVLRGELAEQQSIFIITNEEKELYMILLDRRCLSECNGDAWRDEYGVTFIDISGISIV